jgi:hypothetical protein
MMTIPDPPTWTPVFNDLTPANIPQLPVAAWMLTYTATDVGPDALPWMLAQGWQIYNIDYDTTTTPSTPYYDMTRDGVSTGAVLQSLVNLYTNEYNTGRYVNDLRYEEIVSNWTNMLYAMTTHVSNMADTSNAAAVWVSDLNVAVSEVQNKVTAAETELQTYADDLWAKVDALADHFSSLETYYTDAATKLTTIITSQSTALTAYTTDYDAKIVEMEAALTSTTTNIQTAIANVLSALTTYVADYDAAMVNVVSEMTVHETAARAIETDAENDLDAHIGTFQLELDALSTDYASHLSTIETLLTSVSTAFSDHETEILALLATILADHTAHDTEIDAIVASYDSTFSDHKTDYESILALLKTDWDGHSSLTTGLLDGLGGTDTARITEEFQATLSAQIQHLTDHGLYTGDAAAALMARNTRDRDEQIQLLNDRLNREKVENEHKLYEQLFRVRTANLNGKDKLYGLKQAATQFRAQMITRAYDLLQDVRNRTLSGRQQLQALEQDVLRYQVTVREALASRLEAMRDRTMAGLHAIQQLRDALHRWLLDDQHKLYMEQLDVRTKQVEQAERKHAGRMGVYQAEIAARQALLQITESVHGQIVDAHTRYHESEQTVHRNEAAQRDALLGKALATTQAIIAGEAQANQLRQANGEFVTNETHRLAALLMDTKLNSYRLRVDQNAQEMELMKYQADASNNLMVGLWTFQERRNDMYPSLDLIAQLVSQLGDTGATSWVSP